VTLDGERSCATWCLENQVLYGTVNAGPPSFDHAIADLAKFEARWPEQVRALITGHYPPEQITEVLGREGGDQGRDSLRNAERRQDQHVDDGTTGGAQQEKEPWLKHMT
jgi:hypothetical protein